LYILLVLTQSSSGITTIRGVLEGSERCHALERGDGLRRSMAGCSGTKVLGFGIRLERVRRRREGKKGGERRRKEEEGGGREKNISSVIT
jgi:hypothetical protein